MNNLNLNRVVILLRGVSGSSKTTFAEYLKDIFYWNPDKSCEICCADDQFTDSKGNYNFNPILLPIAHKACQEKFVDALKNGVELVIVSNVNAKPSDFNFYLDKCKEFNYVVFSLIIEKRFEGGDNGHNVPHGTILRQTENIKNNLKLR